jgi:hypothetical protein
MALRGRKPKPTQLKRITGNPGRRPLPSDEPMRVGAIERPESLNGRPGELWDNFIERAYWLTWADGPKALLWVCLQAEFEEAPRKMLSSRIAQLRAVGSELGLDPASRARLAVPAAADDSVGSKYF